MYVCKLNYEKKDNYALHGWVDLAEKKIVEMLQTQFNELVVRSRGKKKKCDLPNRRAPLPRQRDPLGLL